MKQLKNWDNKTWLSSEKYISSFYRFLKVKIKINKETQILDIGCGRANIISFLHKKYKFKTKPFGIDIVKNKDLKKNIVFKKSDAIKYLRYTDQTYDLILIKQTIHFFTKKRVKTILSLAKKRLNRNGKIFIFSLKTRGNEIPCFKIMNKKLTNSLKKDEVLFEEIKKTFKKIKISYFNYRVVITKKKYIQMLKGRYISCLLNISKKHLVSGIKEIKNKLKKKIIFTDKLLCIIYKKHS